MIPRLHCRIGHYTDNQARFISAVENVLRVQLNPIEEAQAYADIQETGLSHEQIGKELGKSRSHVSNYLRLLTLDIAAKDFLIHGKLGDSRLARCAHSTRKASNVKSRRKPWAGVER